ncbi:MAG: ABC transporter permease [Massilia sp.]
MKIFFELLRADFLILLRGRVGMFWTLAFPALMMVMQMTLFGGSPSLGPVNLTIVNSGASAEGLAYAEYLRDSLGKQTAVRANVRIAGANAAPADVVLVIPPDFAGHVGKGLTSRVAVNGTLGDPTTWNAVLGILRGMTDAYNIEASGKPRQVSLDVKKDGFEKKDYTLFIVTGLAGMITLSTSLMGFAPVLVGAREGGMFKMYRLFPMWRGTVLLVWIVSRLLLTMLASALMFALATLLYKMRIDAPVVHIAGAFALLGAGVCAFLSIGMIIATWSTSVATATMIANLLYFPLLFSGNVIIPVSGLPRQIRELLGYLPLNALVENMRAMLTGRINAGYLAYTLFTLVAMSILCLSYSFKSSRWMARG